MKASNIFQNPGIKNNSDVKLPMLKALGSPLKKYGKHSPNKFNAGLKKAAADGKLDNNPKFKAAVEASPAKMGHKKPSPAKGYKSDAQRKAVHASKADGGKGAPAKMGHKKSSPAKAHCVGKKK